jgi:hypothetical protein
MASNKARGDAHELEVVHFLEAEGWSVFKQHRKIVGMIPTKRGFMPRMAGSDIFGCDILAKKKGHLTRWIQVGAEGNKSKKEDQLNEFYWDTDHESVEIWLRVKGKKAYRVYVLKRVDLQGAGQGQSFVDSGLVEVGRAISEARARLLSGGASSVR